MRKIWMAFSEAYPHARLFPIHSIDPLRRPHRSGQHEAFPFQRPPLFGDNLGAHRVGTDSNGIDLDIPSDAPVSMAIKALSANYVYKSR
ncbi:MAG: hypothetical protein ACREXU_05990 [Gammaproteobacteria bacterium]